MPFPQRTTVVRPTVAPVRAPVQPPARTAAPAPKRGYGAIAEAEISTQYPWFDQPGRYLVVCVGWRSQMNLSGKFADVFDLEVVHTYRGAYSPGERFCRMRTENQWNSHLKEIKQRVQAALSALQGEMIPEASIQEHTILAITEGGELEPGNPATAIPGNGEVFSDTYLIAEVMPLKANTRSTGSFTPVNWYVPTAGDLEAAGIQVAG